MSMQGLFWPQLQCHCSSLQRAAPQEASGNTFNNARSATGFTRATWYDCYRHCVESSADSPQFYESESLNSVKGCDRERKSWQLKMCRGAFSGDGEIAGIVPRKIQAEGVASAGRGGLCFALDGSISILMPLWQEELSPPLRALRRLLESKVPQCCGLNPKSNRQVFSPRCRNTGLAGIIQHVCFSFSMLLHLLQVNTRIGIEINLRSFLIYWT